MHLLLLFGRQHLGLVVDQRLVLDVQIVAPCILRCAKLHELLGIVVLLLLCKPRVLEVVDVDPHLRLQHVRPLEQVLYLCQVLRWRRPVLLQILLHWLWWFRRRVWIEAFGLRNHLLQLILLLLILGLQLGKIVLPLLHLVQTRLARLLGSLLEQFESFADGRCGRLVLLLIELVYEAADFPFPPYLQLRPLVDHLYLIH